MGNKLSKRTSKGCDRPSQHKKGMGYFISAIGLFIVLIIVAILDYVITFTIVSWFLYLIYILLSIGIGILLIVGILVYGKCGSEEFISAVSK